MAPKKRPNVALVVEPSTRVTRSSTRLANTHHPIEQPHKAKKLKKDNFENNLKNQETLKQEAEKVLEEEGSKTIVIEHCKQCNSFKTRAIMVKEGLEKGVPGVKVVINPEKPRKGCFEIREEGENGEKFISLLDMPRPFTPMKELNMEKLVTDIVEKIK